MMRILSILVVFAALLFVVPRAFAAPAASDELGDDSATVWTLYEGSITVEMSDGRGYELKADESNLAPVISGERDRDLN